MLRRVSPYLLLLPALFLAPQRAFAAQVVDLWPAGHRTLKGVDEKEILAPPGAQRSNGSTPLRTSAPTIEVYSAPADKANGCIAIVAPGGGHQFLSWSSEGTDIAEWLNGIGVTAFVLKCRLTQTPNYQYPVEGILANEILISSADPRSRRREALAVPNHEYHIRRPPLLVRSGIVEGAFQLQVSLLL